MVAFYGIAATAGLYIGKAMGMDVPLIAGTFAGSVTNTPALAAAGEASGDPARATVATRSLTSSASSACWRTVDRATGGNVFITMLVLTHRLGRDLQLPGQHPVLRR